jgi:uncharacterized protein YjbI with pentapeptide repeats
MAITVAHPGRRGLARRGCSLASVWRSSGTSSCEEGAHKFDPRLIARGGSVAPATRRDQSGRVDLSGAVLTRTQLRGARLRYSMLTGASMTRVDLRGADLRGTRFAGADMRRADLHGACLRGALVSTTDLTGANLEGADLRGADLREATLAQASLENATYDANTKWTGGPATGSVKRSSGTCDGP